MFYTISTHTSLILNNILYVPQIAKNLLSIAKLTTDNPVFVEFHHNCCIVKDRFTKMELLQGTLCEGLYQLRIHQILPALHSSQSVFNYVNIPAKSLFLQSSIQSLFAQSSSLVSKLDLWHMQFGHPNLNVMKNMLNDENLSFKTQLTFCDACHIGKSKHKHYNSSLTVTHKPLELIHSDVWGPSPILSKDGFHYYVHFLDDYSNFTWIFSLKLKSEVQETFLKFQKTCGKTI